MRKKWLLRSVLISCLFLVGCTTEGIIKEKPTEVSEQMRGDKDKLLDKTVAIPISLKEGQKVYGMALGDNYEQLLEVLGEPLESYKVTDKWRYDTVLTYAIQKVQVDIALFRDHIDEVTVTVPHSLSIDEDELVDGFEGLRYQLTDEKALKEKNAVKVRYYVQKEKDQWLIVQEKKDGSWVFTSTYTYDFSYLIENGLLKELEE